MFILMTSFRWYHPDQVRESNLSHAVVVAWHPGHLFNFCKSFVSKVLRREDPTSDSSCQEGIHLGLSRHVINLPRVGRIGL